MINLLYNLIIVIFDICILYYWNKLFFVKEKQIRIYLLLISMLVIAFIVNCRTNNSLILLLMTMIFSSILAYINSYKFSYSICISVIYCMANIFIEVLIGFLMISITNQTLSSVRFDPNNRLFGAILAKFVLFVLTNVTLYKLKKIAFKGIKRVIILLILPMISILIIYQTEYYFHTEKTTETILYNYIVIFGLIISNISIFILLENDVQYEQKALKLTYYNEIYHSMLNHYKTLELSDIETRRMRHDMCNTFIALSGMAKNNETNQIIYFCNQQTEKLQHISKLSIDVGHPSINAMLSSKYLLAQNNNIKLTYTIKLPDNLFIDVVDLCIILGNLLDNAIEACCKIDTTDTEARAIILKLETHNEYISLKLANTIPISHTKNFTSLKTDTLNHGFGMTNIRIIASSYNGHIDYVFSDYIFEIYVLLENRPNE